MKNIFTNISVKWADKEIKIPVIGSLLILILAGIILTILYSSWSCGPVKHDANDMPKTEKKK